MMHKVVTLNETAVMLNDINDILWVDVFHRKSSLFPGTLAFSSLKDSLSYPKYHNPSSLQLKMYDCVY